MARVTKAKARATKGTASKSKTGRDKAEVPLRALVQSLLDDLNALPKNANNIVALLRHGQTLLTTPVDEPCGRLLSLGLRTYFATKLKAHAMDVLLRMGEPEQMVAKWMRARYHQYVEWLAQVVSSAAPVPSWRLDCVDHLMLLVEAEAAAAHEPFFPANTYSQLRAAVLAVRAPLLEDGTSGDPVVVDFAARLSLHYDLQFYFVNGLAPELKDRSLETFGNFLTIGRSCEWSVPSGDAVPATLTTNLPQAVSKALVFRNQFSKAWLAALALPLTLAQYTTALVLMHKRVIPFMNDPTQLMDFLTDLYAVGGLVLVLALNSLFELIKSHNLEYPHFYTQLYSLLDHQLLRTRYRLRFFRLCDTFLASPLLPSAIVCLFVKRLARLALTAPAGGAVLVIPFVYNMLKRHPLAMVMIHNPHAADDYQDPFSMEEGDPLLTNALRLLLWELETLMSHYHPNIATLAKIFGEPFRKQHYNLEDFLDWGYALLLLAERNKRYKEQTAALEYEEWESVFGAANSFVPTWQW